MRQSKKYLLLLGACFAFTLPVQATTVVNPLETDDNILAAAGKISPIRRTLAADLVSLKQFEAATSTKFDNAVISAVTASSKVLFSVDDSFNARVTASIGGSLRTFTAALAATYSAAGNIDFNEDTRDGVGSPASPWIFRILLAKGTGTGDLTRAALINFLLKVTTDTYTTVAGGVTMASTTPLSPTIYSAKGQFLDGTAAITAGTLGAEAAALTFTAKRTNGTTATFTANLQNAHTMNVASSDTTLGELKFNNTTDVGEFIKFNVKPAKLDHTKDIVTGLTSGMSAMPKVISQTNLSYVASLNDQIADYQALIGGSTSINLKQSAINQAKVVIDSAGFTAADVVATSKADSGKIFLVKVGAGDVTGVTYSVDDSKVLIKGTTAPEDEKTYTLDLTGITTFNAATGALIAYAPDGDAIIVRVGDATGYSTASNTTVDASELDNLLASEIKMLLGTTGNITTITAMTLTAIQTAAQS
ncbi:MAG: hypothetical protein ACTHJ4_04265 [Candidatus Nucleicultricaceae bacterium]